METDPVFMKRTMVGKNGESTPRKMGGGQPPPQSYTERGGQGFDPASLTPATRSDLHAYGHDLAVRKRKAAQHNYHVLADLLGSLFGSKFGYTQLLGSLEALLGAGDSMARLVPQLCSARPSNSRRFLRLTTGRRFRRFRRRLLVVRPVLYCPSH